MLVKDFLVSVQTELSSSVTNCCRGLKFKIHIFSVCSWADTDRWQQRISIRSPLLTAALKRMAERCLDGVKGVKVTRDGLLEHGWVGPSSRLWFDLRCRAHSSRRVLSKLKHDGLFVPSAGRKYRKSSELLVWDHDMVWGYCLWISILAYKYVCVSRRKKVPDEWQARQATPAILQVSSSKHNAKKITRERGPFHQSISAILTEEKREEKQFTKPTHVAVYLFRDQDRSVCVCIAVGHDCTRLFFLLCSMWFGHFMSSSQETGLLLSVSETNGIVIARAETIVHFCLPINR